MARTPEQVEALLDKLEGLLADVDGAKDRFDRDQWHDRHVADFEDLEDKLKTLNGEDFDIYKESYDEYNGSYKDLGEDGYVKALKENIKKVFDRVWPEASEEEKEEAAEEVVESTEDVEPTAEVTTVETEEVPVEEVPEKVEEVTEEPDEIEQLRKDVEAERAKYDARNKKE